MPTATLTAVAPSTNLQTVPFTVDPGPSQCLDLLALTTRITLTNTGTVAFNVFIVPFGQGGCQGGGGSGPGTFTLVPNVPHDTNIGQFSTTQLSMQLFAQDVGQGTYHVSAAWNVPPANCQFGTRIKAGFPQAAAVTTEIITAALDPPGALFLAPVLSALVGQTLVYSDLCGKLPPALPDITASTPQQSLQTWMQILLALTWPVACECVPGTPAPTPPPLPVVPQPAGFPVYPTLPPCANADPCVQLQDLVQRVSSLQQSMTQLYSFEQLVQRYVIPFSYIRGRRFSTLVATGSQPINRCVGLLVEVTQHPAANRTLLGVPEYIFDLGWISVVDADGMIDEIRLTRQATTWLSKLIPTATQVGWGLRDGVTVEISELLAEP